MNIFNNIFIITILVVSGDVIGVVPQSPCELTPVTLDTILPAANIDYSSLTVSGFSGGAAMSMQYHVAFSAEVKGAGIFAGVPYGSFYGNALGIPPSVLHFITGPNVIGPGILVPIPLIPPTNNSVLETNIESFVESGLIDDTNNLTGSKVYVFHGTVDSFVDHVYGERLVSMYGDYGASLKTIMTMVAAHTVPTDNYLLPLINDCSIMTFITPWINNCNYKGVFDMFSHFYGSDYISPESSTVAYNGSFSAFNQGPYSSDGNASTDFLDNKGFLYVPTYCQNPSHTCKIHIAFHGCLQNIFNAMICNTFALKTGYLQAADANHIVILFPQASLIQIGPELTSNVFCWDFFGGVSNTSWFKSGPQMAAVRKMSRAVAKLPLA